MIYISAVRKILQTNNLLQSLLQEHEYSQEIDLIKGKLIINFQNGYSLYVRFNDFDEYSYHFIYSKKENDRFRFDNYDDRWNVNTRPNHLHPRGSKNATNSLMNGEPNHNIPVLIKYIQENVILK